MYRKFLKRIIDFVLSLFVILILSPIILTLIIVLFIVNRGAIFFIQARPGKNEKIFKIIKFKTMNDKRDANGKLLHDSLRITKIGKIIRRFSLDELLQFINVLRGEMSIVGPRPLLIQYLSRYNEHQKKRHNIKPGITGWAQVNGRNAISWQERFNLDVYYVENLSFLLDLKIIFLTIVKILKSKDINFDKSITNTEFMGN